MLEERESPVHPGTLETALKREKLPAEQSGPSPEPPFALGLAAVIGWRQEEVEPDGRPEQTSITATCLLCTPASEERLFHLTQGRG